MRKFNLGTIADMGWFREQWYDFSVWLVGSPNTELTIVVIAALILAATTLVLAIVMGVKHPRTPLEKGLFFREVFLAVWIIELIVRFFLNESYIWWRMAAYLGIAATGVAIIFFLLKEYTFDSWEAAEKSMSDRQAVINKQQDNIDTNQQRLTRERRLFRNRVDN